VASNITAVLEKQHCKIKSVNERGHTLFGRCCQVWPHWRAGVSLLLTVLLRLGCRYLNPLLAAYHERLSAAQAEAAGRAQAANDGAVVDR
jgi:hypothetical protein